MRRDKFRKRAFALYEVLLGVTIFAVGVLVLGRSLENCLNASAVNEEENRVRQALSNRMAEIQASPGFPDPTHETKVDTGFGTVKLKEKTVPAGLKNDRNLELYGISKVTLTAEWSRGNVAQSQQIVFYVYRGG
jgi:Tfp pilus assembly protein PilV